MKIYCEFKVIDERKRISRYLRQLLQDENIYKKIGEIKFFDPKIGFEKDEFNKIDKDILKYFDKGVIYSVHKFKETSYYRFQRNYRKKTLNRILRDTLKYYKTYCSIKKNGFKYNLNNRKSVPWMFVSKEMLIRLDGHHRLAICLHFKYEKVPILIITPKDILLIPKIALEIASLMEKYMES